MISPEELHEELFDYSIKSAALREKYSPLPHQQEAIKQFVDNNGEIILAHSTGSGKTASALFCFESARKLGAAHNALVVVPTGLRTNFAEKGVKKFTDDAVQVFGNKQEVSDGSHVDFQTADKTIPYSVVGYELFRQAPHKYMEASGADTLIVDEVHKARDTKGVNFKALMLARAMATNFIGLTGSVVSNKPSDIIALMTLSAGYPIAGSQTEFEKRYMSIIGSREGFLGGKKDITVIIRPSEIQQRFGKLVNFVSHEDLERTNPTLFPKKQVSEVLVEMSDEQKDLYNYAMGQLPFITRYKIEHNIPMDKREAQTVFGKIIRARQVSNSIATMGTVSLEEAADRTPKIKKVLDDAQEHLQTTPDGQVVMYSNLVNGGIDVLAAGLKKRGISFGVFIGKGREVGGNKVQEETRQAGVSDYLEGKLRVLLVSEAGAEGLDLKNSTMVQMVDGHFNPEVIQQAEARGVRAKGLEDRPQENRVVIIKRYKSVMPKVGFLRSLFGGGKKHTTDQWIYDVAAGKDVLNEQFRTALQTGTRPEYKPPPGFRPKKYLRRWRVWTATGPEWRYSYGD